MTEKFDKSSMVALIFTLLSVPHGIQKAFLLFIWIVNNCIQIQIFIISQVFVIVTMIFILKSVLQSIHEVFYSLFSIQFSTLTTLWELFKLHTIKQIDQTGGIITCIHNSAKSSTQNVSFYRSFLDLRYSFPVDGSKLLFSKTTRYSLDNVFNALIRTGLLQSEYQALINNSKMLDNVIEKLTTQNTLMMSSGYW